MPDQVRVILMILFVIAVFWNIWRASKTTIREFLWALLQFALIFSGIEFILAGVLMGGLTDLSIPVVISFIIGTIMLLLGIWLIRHRRRQARVRAEQDRIERGRARAAQVHAERKRRIALQTQSPAQIHGE